MTGRWELVDGTETTWRLPVPGGWLYRDVLRVEGEPSTHAMCFVPDPRAAHVVMSPGAMPRTATIDPEGSART